MSQKRSIITDGYWVAGTQLLAALGQLFGIRLLTEILPPHVFGQVSLWQGGAVLVASGLANPTTQALLKFYPEYAMRGNGQIVIKAVSKQLSKLLLWCSIVLVPLIIILMFSEKSDSITVLLLVGIVCLEMLRMQNMALLNAMRAQRAYGVWSIAEAWGRPAMAWFLVIVYGISCNVVLLSYLIISSVIWFVMRWFVPHLGASDNAMILTDLSERIWKYSIPLLPLGLLGWISGMADRYIIGILLTSEDVGLYVAIYGLASRPLLMLGSIVETTFRPVYQQLLACGDKIKARKYLYRWGIILLLLCCSALLISCLWHQFLSNILLGPQYRRVSYLLPWIIAGYSLLAFSDIPLRACYANGKTVSILAVLIVDSILAVVLGFVLINKYSLIGAAVAVPVYYGIRLILAVRFSLEYLIPRRQN